MNPTLVFCRMQRAASSCLSASPPLTHVEDEGKQGEEEQTRLPTELLYKPQKSWSTGTPCASHFYLQAELTFQLDNSKKTICYHMAFCYILTSKLLRKHIECCNSEIHVVKKKNKIKLTYGKSAWGECSWACHATGHSTCSEVMQSGPCIRNNAVIFLAKLILNKGNESLHLCSPIKHLIRFIY